MAPLVSCICLTTHPLRAEYLPSAVRSFRQQTYRGPKELIVVNDGLPMVSRSPDIRVVNLPDIGRRWHIGEKRNVGLREAFGDLVATWDDDDVSLPGRLEDQVRFIEDNGAHYAVCDSMLVADQAMRLVGRCSRGLSKPLQASAMMTRNAAISAGGYQPLDYLEDFRMMETVKLLLRGVVMTMPGRYWYVMRRHELNITNSMGESNCEYGVCAMREPEVSEEQRELNRVLFGPGGDEVVSGS